MLTRGESRNAIRNELVRVVIPIDVHRLSDGELAATSDIPLDAVKTDIRKGLKWLEGPRIKSRRRYSP
jgi:DNA-directed RNA polymerase specialized sigma24 family protein